MRCLYLSTRLLHGHVTPSDFSLPPVPLPSKHYPPAPTTAPPPPPPSSPLVDVDSKLSSSVVTGGGAIVSTTGSTSGSGSVSTVISGPGVFSKTEAAGQAGLSGTSGSAGDGLAVQDGRAKTGELVVAVWWRYVGKREVLPSIDLSYSLGK